MTIDSGIYKFTNKINGKVYIGQTRYLNSRYRSHKSELLNQLHHNSYFQKAVNKYGFDAFDYEIIERCDEEYLNNLENRYIQLYDSTNRQKGYNILEGGNNSRLPEETKARQMIASRGRNNKLTPEKVEEIKLRYLKGEKEIELGREYGVTLAAINKVIRLKNWQYIREDLSERLLTFTDLHLKEREKIVKDLYHKGLRPNQIKTKTGFSTSQINRFLKDEIKAEKIRDSKVREEYMSYKSREEIMDRYDITYAVFKRIVKGLRKNRDVLTENMVMDLRSKGVTVKEIADKISVNRTTITDITNRVNNRKSPS